MRGKVFPAAYARMLAATRFRQLDLARELRMNPVTLGRWRRGKTKPDVTHLRALVAFVGKTHPEEAENLANAAGHSLEAFGLARAAAGGGAFGRSEVESIVYAAADAVDVAPKVARTALFAALARMTELGASIDAVASALRPRKSKLRAP